MGIISKRYTNLEFKFQTKFEFKTKKKKKKTEKGKRKEEEASRPASAQQPSKQPRLRAQQQAGKTRTASPASSPARVAHTRAPPRFPLLPLPLGPACQPPPSTVSSSSPTPLTPPTKPRQRWQERARGSRPGHGPVSLAPCPRNHSRPLDASTRLRSPLIPIHRSPGSAVPRSAIKPRPWCPELSTPRHHFVDIPCTLEP